MSSAGAEELAVEHVNLEARELVVRSLALGDTFAMQWDARHHWLVLLDRP